MRQSRKSTVFSLTGFTAKTPCVFVGTRLQVLYKNTADAQYEDLMRNTFCKSPTGLNSSSHTVLRTEGMKSFHATSD